MSSEATVDKLGRFAGGGSAYLGLPLLVVLLVAVVRRWSRAVVRVGLALLLLAALLSMGPTLLVSSRDTGIWMPWALFEGLPLLDSLIPSRLAQMTALFAGLLLAVLLSTVWHQSLWRRLAAVAVALTLSQRRALALDFARWQGSSVVVGPMHNRAAMVRFLTDLLGRKPEQVGGVFLWRYPVVVLTNRARRRP